MGCDCGGILSKYWRNVVTGAKNLELTTLEVRSPELPSWIREKWQNLKICNFALDVVNYFEITESSRKIIQYL